MTNYLNLAQLAMRLPQKEFKEHLTQMVRTAIVPTTNDLHFDLISQMAGLYSKLVFLN